LLLDEHDEQVPGQGATAFSGSGILLIMIIGIGVDLIELGEFKDIADKKRMQ